MDLRSHTEDLLTQGPQGHSPHPSPTGNHVALVRRADDVSQIFVLPLAAGEPASLNNWSKVWHGRCGSPTERAFSWKWG